MVTCTAKFDMPTAASLSGSYLDRQTKTSLAGAVQEILRVPSIITNTTPHCGGGGPLANLDSFCWMYFSIVRPKENIVWA